MTHELPQNNVPQEDAAARLSRLDQRTREFFSQDIEVLGGDLIDRQIVDRASGARIVVTGIKTYSSETNRKGDKKYKAMLNMNPGDYYAADWPFRNTVLSLIVGQDKDGIGACIQITSASISNPDSGELKEIKRQGDIARTLNLGVHGSEKGRLAFIDDSEDLYVVDRESVESSHSNHIIDPNRARRILDGLVDES